jgi:hypothetical protein
VKATDLKVGGRYVLDRQGGIGVYDGKHEGKMVLADGSTYFGSAGRLRFRITDAEGQERVVLLENGTPVIETEETKLAREGEEAAIVVRQRAAYAEAVKFLHELGFQVTDSKTDEQSISIRNSPNTSYSGRYAAVSADETDLDGITLGKLKRMLRAAGLDPERLSQALGARA